ncbi:MAG: hypothetical protein GY906_23205 [bacterium]|nr:hypothetical protein [bacterium]
MPRAYAEGYNLDFRVEENRDVMRQQDQLFVGRHVILDGQAVNQLLGPSGWKKLFPGTQLDPDEYFTFEHDGEMDKMLAEFAKLAWKRGWRPIEREDTTGRLEDHLADMRRLAFKALKIQGPDNVSGT